MRGVLGVELDQTSTLPFNASVALLQTTMSGEKRRIEPSMASGSTILSSTPGRSWPMTAAMPSL